MQDPKEIIAKRVEMLTRKETIKYIIACLLFGSLTFASRNSNIGSLQLTFLRVMIASFYLMTIFVCSSRRATLSDYSPRQLVYLFVSGVCIGISWLIIADSGKRLGVTTVTLTYSLGPGLLLLLSPLLFKEVRFTATKILGFLICTLGILLMDHQWFETMHEFWEIFDVLVAAFFTVVIVYCNRQLENINGLENAMFQVLIAFIIILFIYIRRHGFYFEVPYPDSVWVVFAGIVNTGLPVYLYLSSVDDLRPDIIAFAGYLRPLTTVFISSVVFGEALGSETYLGATLILGGVAVANFFRRKKLRKNRNF